jgi:hypothetical protein
MTPRYCVDHWFLRFDGKLQRRHYGYDDTESAEHRMDSCIAYPGTTRVRLYRTGPGGSRTVLRIWTKPSW